MLIMINLMKYELITLCVCVTQPISYSIYLCVFRSKSRQLNSASYLNHFDIIRGVAGT